MKHIMLPLVLVAASFISGPSTANNSLCTELQTTARLLTLARQSGQSRETLEAVAHSQPIATEAVMALINFVFEDPILNTDREKALLAQRNAQITFMACRDAMK
jgi:hypothetical protein